MSLTRITISGADDDVDPFELVKLSREFPFVEWGVLVSKRPGRPRYPMPNWLWSLSGAFLKEDVPPWLSAHLCGAAAREFCEGEQRWVRSLPSTVTRVQINGCKPWPMPAGELRVAMRNRSDIELIVQLKQAADMNTSFLFADALPDLRIGALLDPSGGRGLEITDWPRPPRGLHLGYAGGIKPPTIEPVISAIGVRLEPYWLDMESGVRTDDRFDLELVREVLERATPHIKIGDRG
jgi:hypothetical protein